MPRRHDSRFAPTLAPFLHAANPHPNPLDLPHTACNHVFSVTFRTVGLTIVAVTRLYRVAASFNGRAPGVSTDPSGAPTVDVTTFELVQSRLLFDVAVNVPRKTRRCNGECPRTQSSAAHVASVLRMLCGVQAGCLNKRRRCQSLPRQTMKNRGKIVRVGQ